MRAPSQEQQSCCDGRTDPSPRAAESRGTTTWDSRRRCGTTPSQSSCRLPTHAIMLPWDHHQSSRRPTSDAEAILRRHHHALVSEEPRRSSTAQSSIVSGGGVFSRGIRQPRRRRGGGAREAAEEAASAPALQIAAPAAAASSRHHNHRELRWSSTEAGASCRPPAMFACSVGGQAVLQALVSGSSQC